MFYNKTNSAVLYNLLKGTVLIMTLVSVFLLTGCERSDTMMLKELSQAGENTEVSGLENQEKTQPIPEAESESTDKNKPAKQKTIFVHVCGAVENPGVYEILEGSRNYEAVEKAGGFSETACSDYLNMAKLLEDGARLEVPTLSQVKKAEMEGYVIAEDGSILAGNSIEDGLVNINTADAALLSTLPGVGASRAEAIIAFRQERGAFQQKEDIMQVTGIKEGLYSKIESYISVD